MIRDTKRDSVEKYEERYIKEWEAAETKGEWSRNWGVGVNRG